MNIKSIEKFIPNLHLGLKILTYKEIRYKLYKRGLVEDVFQCLFLACLLSNSYKELSNNLSKELYRLERETFLIYKPNTRKISKNKLKNDYKNINHNCDCCNNSHYAYKNKFGYNFLCKICYNRLRGQQNSARNQLKDCEYCNDWTKETRYFHPPVAKKYHHLCNDCYLKLVKELNKKGICKICGWKGTRYHNLCKSCYNELRKEKYEKKNS